MKPFLQQIATLFYNTYGSDMSRFAFVFPNKRAGLFFRKYLGEITERPMFAPPIITLVELFTQLSGKEKADRIHMLFTLYRLYIERSHAEESFDEFFYWGEMLIRDFDDVDKQLANARMLFTNVTDLKQIETDFTFLSEQQTAAIRTFWSSFRTEKSSPNQDTFLAAWEILYDLYCDFRETLESQGLGYEGMIFREVAEQFKQGEEADLPWSKVIFVGMHALSQAEETFLRELKKRGLADFYWDYTSEKVTDRDNLASFFALRNQTLFPSQLMLPDEEPVDTEIEVIGIPSGVGQAKQIHTLLENLGAELLQNEEEALRTAIVLPDEHLLIPVLNAIPEQIRRINVTMGYPLAGTPVASLMEYILNLHKNLRYADRKPQFYFRDVLPILNHRYIVYTDPERVTALIHDITAYNRIYISAEDLGQTPFLRILFHPVPDTNVFSDYLLRVMEELNRALALAGEKKEIQEDETEEETDPAQGRLTLKDVEQEFIFHYFITVNRMREIMHKDGISMQLNTYMRLLKRMTDSITIPFEGEPLAGLQIMGVLETRMLDFDRVIILSMNEGIFPAKKSNSSFIPYNLRRGFGLPTYEHQDSTWAYHFYRLIHRAKQVHLLYDTRSSGLLSGEVSRYIHQLHYHYQEPLKRKLVIFNVSSGKKMAVEGKKNRHVMDKLDRFRQEGDRALSASAINTYLDCPLKFYFSVVEEVQDVEEVNENLESDIFGSILHKVLEDVYHPLLGKMVTADLLKLLRQDDRLLTTLIERAFARLFFRSEQIRPLTGRNYLIGEMIRKYVKKVLQRDSKLTPFRYLCSEMKINDTFTLSDGSPIQLKGFIDRIDEVGDTVRIIDYKSGRGSCIFNTIDGLFDLQEKERAKAVMQVFMYAWSYNRMPEGQNRRIAPGIYYMREIFNDSFDPAVYRRIERMKKDKVECFSDYAGEFEVGMRRCLDEIFNPQQAFCQTPSGKACSYCNFKDICGHK